MVHGADQPGTGGAKKLRALGRYWATGDQGQQIAADADAWGIDIGSLPQTPTPSVWPEQIGAWNTFAGCATQWRVIAGQSALLHQGLDYNALESVMRMQGVEDMPAVFAQVRDIEAGALEVINR